MFEHADVWILAADIWMLIFELADGSQKSAANIGRRGMSFSGYRGADECVRLSNSHSFSI